MDDYSRRVERLEPAVRMVRLARRYYRCQRSKRRDRSDRCHWRDGCIGRKRHNRSHRIDRCEWRCIVSSRTDRGYGIHRRDGSRRCGWALSIQLPAAPMSEPQCWLAALDRWG